MDSAVKIIDPESENNQKDNSNNLNNLNNLENTKEYDQKESNSLPPILPSQQPSDPLNVTSGQIQPQSLTSTRKSFENEPSGVAEDQNLKQGSPKTPPSVCESPDSFQ